MEKYQAHVIERERERGASQEAIDRKAAELKKFAELYRNPLVNVAITFVEPLPVGLVVALVSAGILRRRRGDGVAAGKAAVA